MSLRTPAFRYAAVVVVFGVLVNALTMFFLFAFPQHVLTEAAQAAYLDAWFHPVGAVGGSITLYAVPLLAAVGGFYFVRTDRASARETLVGFAVAGAVFAVAVVALGWAVTHPTLRASTLGYLGHTVSVAVRFVGAAAVGALAALLLAGRRRDSVRVAEN